jgi:hypothetical protein
MWMDTYMASARHESTRDELKAFHLNGMIEVSPRVSNSRSCSYYILQCRGWGIGANKKVTRGFSPEVLL